MKKSFIIPGPGCFEVKRNFSITGCIGSKMPIQTGVLVIDRTPALIGSPIAPMAIYHMQWRSQNAVKGTHIKERLLDQAVIPFNCVPFRNGNFS